MSKGSARRRENRALVERNWPTTWNLRDDIVAPDGSVSDIDRTANPYWNNATSAVTGRECGGPEPECGDNSRHLTIGLHTDCGAREGVTSSRRASEEGAGHG